MVDIKEIPNDERQYLTIFKVHKIKNPEQYGGWTKKIYWGLTIASVLLMPLVGLVAGIIGLRSSNEIKKQQGLCLTLVGIFMVIIFWASPPQYWANLTGSDTDHSNAAKDPDARERAIEQIVNSDRGNKELERYTSCVAILSLINGILNNTGREDLELTLTGTYAHQAAIYSIALNGIRFSYPTEELGRVDEMRAKWAYENLPNKNIKQLYSFKNDLCPFFETDSAALDAGKLMVEYEGFYKEQYELYLNNR